MTLLDDKNLYDDSLFDNSNYLHLKNKDLIVLIIRIDYYYNMSYTNQDFHLFNYGISNISGEIINTLYNFDILEFNNDIVIILNIENNKQSLYNLAAELKTQIKLYLKHSVSIGIGNHCNSLKKLHTSYKEALISLEYKFFSREDSILFFDDLEQNHKNNTLYPLKLEEEIINSIKNGSNDNIQNSYNSFIKYIIESNTSKYCTLRLNKILFLSIYHMMLENNINDTEILNDFDNIYSYDKYITLNEFSNAILKLILVAADKISYIKVNNKIMQRALKYIDINYNKNINLHDVAKNAYITPTYVSILFKHVLGINFVDYLHKVRLSKACELLKNDKLKCYEIAYNVGFNDEKYFIQIFKKHFGQTPLQYRNSQK